jgi:putative redox protein
VAADTVGGGVDTQYVVEAVHQGGMHFTTRIGERTVSMDYPLAPGEAGAGPRPLEMLLASLASCAGGSVIALLRRARQPIDGLTVTARGIRRSEHPTVFTEIALEFLIAGNVQSSTVAAVLQETETRVCPVWAMLKPTTPITSSFRITAT